MWKLTSNWSKELACLQWVGGIVEPNVEFGISVYMDCTITFVWKMWDLSHGFTSLNEKKIVAFMRIHYVGIAMDQRSLLNEWVNNHL